ncbi:MAG: hypothetical protein WBP79_11615 [Candidatus Acidiferrales bacterium]
MKLIKQALAVLGAVIVIAVIVAVVTPKAVRAVVAAAVQVVNTSANPVPTYASETRFETSVCSVLGTVSTATNLCPPGVNTFVVPTTTSTGAQVRRLVVDNVSGFCSSFDNPSLFVMTVRLYGQFTPDSVPNGSTSFVHYIPIVAAPYSYVNSPSAPFPYASHPETDYTYGQATHFGFNPGDTITTDAYYFYAGVGIADYFCLARVEGNLETQ